MAIATSVRDCLARQNIQYELLTHSHTHDSLHTAHAAHVPGDLLAKGVMLEDDRGYLMAVIPATRRVDVGVLGRELGRRLGLATEAELGDIFSDCERGAVPPVGSAYGVEMMVDETLTRCKEVYFEAGNHTDLVHLSGDEFMRLMDGARRGQFSHHL